MVQIFIFRVINTSNRMDYQERRLTNTKRRLVVRMIIDFLTLTVNMNSYYMLETERTVKIIIFYLSDVNLRTCNSYLTKSFYIE